MSERQRKQLDSGWREGVEAWQGAAADQCERKTLVAVAEEVTPGQHIADAKMFIDLSDQAVNPVRESRGREEIVSVRIRGNIRLGPWLASQQVGDDWIFSSRVNNSGRG